MAQIRLEVGMTYDQIVAVLGYAGSHERPVRIVTTGRQEVTGIPTQVDADETTHEVYLRPVNDDRTEIVLSLGAIERVELL